MLLVVVNKMEALASCVKMKATLPVLLVILGVTAINGQANCPCHGERANKATLVHTFVLKDPGTCTIPACIHFTKPNKRTSAVVEKLPTSERTNSIQDFCFISDMYKAGDKQMAPIPSGNSSSSSCYGTPLSTVSHTAGTDPNWVILEYLSQHFAQSYQPFNDLPYVNDHYRDDDFLAMNENYTDDALPTPLAPNPYFVEVTGISVKGELLQNFLHFRIFANMSVALGKSQYIRSKTLHGSLGSEGLPVEKANYATGKISAALIMVKDQDGWPVGDFSTILPCARTCDKYSHDVYTGDERNALPCSFTPPHASSHPGMFVFDVDPGRYCPKPYDSFKPTSKDKTNTTTPAPTPAPGAPGDPRDTANTNRLEGVREVHATWSFGHTTCNFVQRLYIQTLIFEDVETVFQAVIRPIPVPAPPPPPEPPLPPDFKNVLFGWSAQYNILETTRSTLGAPDYVDTKYLNELDKLEPVVDCHVPLWDSLNPVPSGFRKYLVPAHKTIIELDGKKGEKEIKVPSRTAYIGELTGIFSRLTAANQPRRDFGQHGPKYPSETVPGTVCRGLPKDYIISEEEKKAGISDEPPERISEFLIHENQKGLRCPCPALPTTLSPENQTTSPEQVYARNLHAQHMTVAYMLLTPIACFVVRYYKETFITVFCFQEYWWYMWHVVILLTACMFNVGALSSIVKQKYWHYRYLFPRLNQPNLLVHYILGVLSICIFYLQCVTGFFRSSNPEVRKRNIFTHWLIGCLNNACAVGSMFAMAFVNQSAFSCKVGGMTVFWLLFVISCYLIMELNLRKTSKKLKLAPKRTYLPPPMKRLFTREPPGRTFRLVMLLIFIAGLIIIEGLVLYFLIDNMESGISCWEEIQNLKKPSNNTFAEDEYDVGEAISEY